MLAPAGVKDRLRSQSAQYPAHPSELRRRHREVQGRVSEFGFNAEFTRLLLAIIKYKIAHNACLEVREAGNFEMTVPKSFLVDHPGLPLRIAWERSAGVGRRANLAWEPWLGFIVPTHPDYAEVHRVAGRWVTIQGLARNDCRTMLPTCMAPPGGTSQRVGSSTDKAGSRGVAQDLMRYVNGGRNAGIVEGMQDGSPGPRASSSRASSSSSRSRTTRA